MCRWPWPGGVGGVCWWHAAWWPEPGGLGLVAGAVVAGAVVAGAVVAGAWVRHGGVASQRRPRRARVECSRAGS